MLKELRLQTGIIIVLAAVILLAFYLFGSNEDETTPEYALKSVSTAINSHDTQRFDHYVNLDSVLNSAYDDFVVGTLDSDKGATDQTRKLVNDFTDAIKVPLLAHVNTSIHNYIKTGEWQKDQEKTDGGDFVNRTGLDKLQFTGINDVVVSEDGQSATAHVSIKHEDLDDNFVLSILMQKINDVWTVTKIDNFKQFTIAVNNMKNIQLERYLRSLSAIINAHDQNVLEYDVEYGKILSAGSLGSDNTRAELKNLMDKVKTDWANRKEKIMNLDTPDEASTLSHLWTKICDYRIAYATNYSLWMTDKKAETVRNAEENLKQAQTLEQEAKGLLTRMELDLGIPQDIQTQSTGINIPHTTPSLLPE